MGRFVRWFKWKLIEVSYKRNWNLTLRIDGRVVGTRRGFDWRNQRTYFSGDSLDFSPHNGGGYTKKPPLN